MNFHVAHPQRTVDLHFRVEEVGTGIPVVQTGVDDFHGLSVCGGKRVERKHPVLPYIVKKLLHDCLGFL